MGNKTVESKSDDGIINFTRKELKEAGILGPWMDEPDKIQWENSGLNCLIVRNAMMFNLCGYVGVPKGHPFYEVDSNDIDVSVWGGVTFTGHCHGRICHTPKEGRPDDVWWIGFDHAHSGDVVPGMLRFIPKMPWSERNTYFTVEMVKKEVNNLAKQLAKMNKSV